MNLSRRRFLIGASAVAAAAVIKANIPPAAIEPGAYLSEQPAWVPEGWLLPRGQMVSRTEYARLFAAIGDAYGDASPLGFRLPDFTGREFSNFEMRPNVAWLIAADDHDSHSVFGRVPAGLIVPMIVKPEA